MQPLVSVIIPVYNLECYIENCLNSVINQTYKNLEILCVDDGSTDKSAEIIEALAKKDTRIKLIRQPNGGVSVARNTGLDNFIGEYVTFVDGDDYLHLQFVDILLDDAIRNSIDIVCCLHSVCKSVGDNIKEIEHCKISKISYEDVFANRNEGVVGKSSCGKLYTRSVAKSATFPVGITNGEDAYYVISLLNQGCSVSLTEEKLYYYLARDNSTVRSDFNYNKFTITKSFDMICDNLKNTRYPFLNSYSLQYLYQSIFYNRTMSVGTQWEDEIKKESKRIGKKWLKAFWSDGGISPKIKLMFTAFFCSRHIYELARLAIDPTMKDFYKSRRKNNK